jgi:hypothetical protein
MAAAPPPPTWTVTSVLERAYALARDNFAAFVTVTMVFLAVSLVVDALSLGLLGGIIHLLCGVTMAICLTWGALQAMNGRKPEWQPILRRLQAPGFGMLLLLGLIQYVVIAMSALLVIPPFFLLPLWAVTIPVMMVERTDIPGAFSRSIELTRNRRLPILGVFVLWAFIFFAGSVVVVLLLGQGAVSRLVLWIYAAVAATVLQPLPAVFYVLLREEKEGATVGQIAGALDQ